MMIRHGFKLNPEARDMNISVTCAHCGEILDTNEAVREDIGPSGELDLSDLEFHVGTSHKCFHDEHE